MARRSSVPKRGEGVAPVHDGMFSMTRGATLGSAPNGAPPDASSPLPTDPSRQGKVFPVPAVAQGCKSDPQRGRYDPALAHAIFDEAKRASDDLARDLHTVLPGRVTEEDCAND